MIHPLVSIIMPAYNAAGFIADAIQSVLQQDHDNWELIVINDDSTDDTEQAVLAFHDDRIKYFKQKNFGVSAARNLGLAHRQGDFFCFLDADDRMPAKSVSSRLHVFSYEPSVRFVDGVVEKWNNNFKEKVSEWHPNFQGSPLNDLLLLSGQSFFGPSWMVKLAPNVNVQMREGLTHGEDLLFYMELSRQFPEDLYSFTNEVVLHYRIHSKSAMQNLKGLDMGYRQLASEIQGWSEISDEVKRKFYRKTRTIMFKSLLCRFQPIQALKALR